MRPGAPSVPRDPLVPHRWTAGLAVALLALCGCAAGPTAERRAARAGTTPALSADTPMSPVPDDSLIPSTGTRGPAPVRIVDPLGIPPPPPGSVTSDAGSRLARPTPVGQLAPEEPPPADDPAPTRAP